MKNILLLQLIKESQLLLINNPQDYAHDITHHYRTWLNALKITKNIEENYDIDVLELICWWHDVQIKAENKSEKRICEITAKYLSSKFEGKNVEIILDSIKNHEFGSKPTYIEGKILQDADKLELLSPERFRIAIKAIKAGLLSKEYFLGKVVELKEGWLPKMPEMYNFEVSGQLHAKRLQELELDKLIDEICLL